MPICRSLFFLGTFFYFLFSLSLFSMVEIVAAICEYPLPFFCTRGNVLILIHTPDDWIYLGLLLDQQTALWRKTVGMCKGGALLSFTLVSRNLGEATIFFFLFSTLSFWIGGIWDAWDAVKSLGKISQTCLQRDRIHSALWWFSFTPLEWANFYHILPVTCSCCASYVLISTNQLCKTCISSCYILSIVFFCFHFRLPVQFSPGGKCSQTVDDLMPSHDRAS